MRHLLNIIKCGYRILWLYQGWAAEETLAHKSYFFLFSQPHVSVHLCVTACVWAHMCMQTHVHMCVPVYRNLSQEFPWLLSTWVSQMNPARWSRKPGCWGIPASAFWMLDFEVGCCAHTAFMWVLGIRALVLTLIHWAPCPWAIP